MLLRTQTSCSRRHGPSTCTCTLPPDKREKTTATSLAHSDSAVFYEVLPTQAVWLSGTFEFPTIFNTVAGIRYVKDSETDDAADADTHR